MFNTFKFAVAAAALFVASSQACAADMPVKAQPIPFVLGYSGSGWYKFIGTAMQANDSQTALGNVNTFGGSLIAGFGYQRANSPGGTFTAVEASCAYHNVGGSNIVGSMTSTWSCDGLLKFGGPITNVLQWLPAGASFPTLPAIGAAVGSAHPWVGVGGTVQDAHASVIGVDKHNVSGKFIAAAGILQQYCTAPLSCLTMDTYFKFSPKQDGFQVLGTNQNIGKQYEVGVHFAF
jgi:hypothetical protein